MGKKIVLSGTALTDTAAPRLAAIDPIESAGSLYLIEPAHPKEAWSAGTPADGGSVPNVFGDTLAGLAAGAVDPVYDVSGDIANGTKGAIERSAKGGLHVIISQVNALANGDGVTIRPPAAMVAYINAHQGNDYFISVWDRLTRAYNGLSGLPAEYAVMHYSGGNGVGFGNGSGWAGTGLVTVLSSSALGNVVGARRGWGAFDRSVGAMAAGQGSAGPLWGAPSTTFNGSVAATHNTKWACSVFYRMYVEDLTVSGRTYAEVADLDEKLFAVACLTPGGRYYGDTFTDPATIP